MLFHTNLKTKFWGLVLFTWQEEAFKDIYRIDWIIREMNRHSYLTAQHQLWVATTAKLYEIKIILVCISSACVTDLELLSSSSFLPSQTGKVYSTRGGMKVKCENGPCKGVA